MAMVVGEVDAGWLARRAHIERRRLDRILSGERGSRATELLRIGAALAVRPAWLLSGEGPMNGASCWIRARQDLAPNIRRGDRLFVDNSVPAPVIAGVYLVLGRGFRLGLVRLGAGASRPVLGRVVSVCRSYDV